MVRERRYYVYIMAGKSRVIYVGVTGFLMARVLRHKAGEGGAFTSQVSSASAGLFSQLSERGGRSRARDGDQGMAAGEESGFDSCGQSYLGGFGRGLGRPGSDEGVGDSGFLTGLSPGSE
jgi:hypothetical protein